MILRIFLFTVTLGVATTNAQTAVGEIAGRLVDGQGGILPGVRVTITSGDESRETFTDSDGRFALRSLPMGTYQVLTTLPGFRAPSGEITLSLSTPRAFLAWSLEVGCLAVIDRIDFDPRGAAPRVEAILHLRVEGTPGRVLMSVEPDCQGEALQEYAVQILGSVPGGYRPNAGRRQVYMEPRHASLMAGQEYLVLVWPDGRTTDNLALPIVSGRVVAPGSRELNGLRPAEALDVLAKWAEERQR